jgi:class 3 adenylate cyclase
MSHAGPVTILVADLLGPEELVPRWQDAPECHRGERLADDTGRIVLVLPDVPAALSYAMRLQRGGDGEPGREPGGRIGIDSGDEDGHPASPQVVATGLCARAEPGQVLLSHAAHALPAGRPGHGAFELDAVRDRVRSWELPCA